MLLLYLYFKQSRINLDFVEVHWWISNLLFQHVSAVISSGVKLDLTHCSLLAWVTKLKIYESTSWIRMLLSIFWCLPSWNSATCILFSSEVWNWTSHYLFVLPKSVLSRLSFLYFYENLDPLVTLIFFPDLGVLAVAPLRLLWLAPPLDTLMFLLFAIVISSSVNLFIMLPLVWGLDTSCAFSFATWVLLEMCTDSALLSVIYLLTVWISLIDFLLIELMFDKLSFSPDSTYDGAFGELCVIFSGSIDWLSRRTMFPCSSS